MTGMGMTVAAGVTASGGGGPPALHISLSNTGSNPVLVSGASGSSTIFSYTISGGSGVYTVDTGPDNMGINPSGKLGEGPPSTGPNSSATTGTFDITWTSFVINETESATFSVSVTDSLGANASVTPFSVSVKRTS